MHSYRFLIGVVLAVLLVGSISSIDLALAGPQAARTLLSGDARPAVRHALAGRSAGPGRAVEPRPQLFRQVAAVAGHDGQPVVVVAAAPAGCERQAGERGVRLSHEPIGPGAGQVAQGLGAARGQRDELWAGVVRWTRQHLCNGLKDHVGIGAAEAE